MKFLGVEFNTLNMSMEITMLSETWARKTFPTKQDLQSILGKLMWVSKVVRFSRCFVAMIILKGPTETESYHKSRNYYKFSLNFSFNVH